MTDHRVVVTDHDFSDLSIERTVLGDIAEIVELPDQEGATDENPYEILPTADAVFNMRYTLGEEEIHMLEKCQIIARYGIGVDNVNLDAATEHGMYVTNVPTYCIEEVTTHAFTLMVALLRGVHQYSESVAAGHWDRDVAAPIHRFSTRTVGIVGFGAIGRVLGERVSSFGADVIASDPFLSSSDLAGHDAELVDFEELLSRADIVSIHSPLTDDTRNMFDRDVISRMKDSAVLINAARGTIIDETALITALDAGEIAGAGLMYSL